MPKNAVIYSFHLEDGSLSRHHRDEVILCKKQGWEKITATKVTEIRCGDKIVGLRDYSEIKKRQEDDKFFKIGEDT